MSPINPDLAAQLQALLDQRSPSTIPSGFFAWWGDTAFPDGGASTPTLTQAEWQRYYLRLQQAALSPSLVSPLFALQGLTREFRPDGPLPVAIANFQIAVPTAACRQRAIDAAANDTPLVPPITDLASAIQGANVFMVAGLLHEQWGRSAPAFRSRVVTYVFDERFYCTNVGAPLPSTIEIDTHDGRGFLAVKFGSRVTSIYPTGDVATATVRCTYVTAAGTMVLTGGLSVPILEVNAAPFPDDAWSLTGIPSLNQGTAYVYRAPGHADVVNPVIIAEGFPGGYPYYYLYDVVNQEGWLEALRAAGYDVILLSFANGLDAMQHNAQVAIDCIRQAMSRTKAKLVVGGLSMGGLVTRFALTALEAHGSPHNTRLFLTIDTPHGGAYTNVADQWLAHYLAPASAEAAADSMLLDSTSNQQFMKLWLHGGTVAESPLRTEFMRELVGIGSYPKEPTCIAVSCGRGDGERSMEPGARLLSWTGSPFASLELTSLPEGTTSSIVAQGYSFLADSGMSATLTVQSDISWEGSPGGQNVYNAVADDIVESIGCGTAADPAPTTCAIPTLSALDIDPATYSPFAPVPAPATHASPFSDYVCNEIDTPHLTITSRVRAWLVEKIGAPPTLPPTPPPAAASPRRSRHSAPPFDPSAFNPHDPAFSKDPYPTYAEFRRHAPVAWVEPYESYWVFRYEDARRVLNDSDNFGPASEPPPGVNDFLKSRTQPPPSPPPPPFDVLANMPEGLFFLDPPDHGRVRTLLEPMFATSIQDATVVAALAARRQLVTAKQSGIIELYSAYALPMPAAVLMTVLGIPQQDWVGIGGWIGAEEMGHDITQPASVQAQGATCYMALYGYLQALMQGCPFHATKGRMLDLMITGAVTPGHMRAGQVQATTANLMIAGYLSTTFLIATGTYNLLNNPNQLAKLRMNPTLLPNAINEMLRYDAPAQLVDRFVATQRVTLGGKELIAGDPVTVVLGSANHDETIFPDADTFDITRDFAPWPHLGFGWGIHRCIGAPLVMEHTAPVAFRMLLDELPTMRLAGTVQWQTDPYLRSVSNLPIAID